MNIITPNERAGAISLCEIAKGVAVRALRQLSRDRRFVFIAVSLLTLGITSALTMGRAIDALLVRVPAFLKGYANAGKLYSSSASGRTAPLRTHMVGIDNLKAGLDNTAQSVVGTLDEELIVEVRGSAERLNVVSYTEGYFEAVGVTPQLGGRPGARDGLSPRTATISHRLWMRRFARSKDVVGEGIHVQGKAYTVGGVAPPGFVGLGAAAIDVWLPLSQRAADGALGEDWRTSTGYGSLQVLLRWPESITRGEVQQRVQAIYELSASRGPTARALRVGELLDARASGGGRATQLVGWSATVSVLMLIAACGTVACLIVIRGLKRARETSLKAALGATRGQLFSEVLAEAVLLGLAAGALSVGAVAVAGHYVLGGLLPASLAEAQILDGRLILVAAAICSITMVGVATVPALSLTTKRMQDLRTYVGAAGVRSWWPSCLVVLQVSICVPLAVGACLFSLSLWRARNVDFGIDGRNAIVVALEPEATGLTSQALHDSHRAIASKLAAHPGVGAVSVVRAVPLVETVSSLFSIPGSGSSNLEAPAYMNSVDPAFFSLMGLRVLAGRLFDHSDNHAGRSPVVVVNRAMASTFWRGDVIGRCFVVGMDDSRCAQIIGVVENQGSNVALDRSAERPAMYYVPSEQYRDLFPAKALLVESRGEPGAVSESLRRYLYREGQWRYARIWAFRDMFAAATRPLRDGVLVFVGFTAVTVVMMLAGVNVANAYRTSTRSHEFAVRIALGAGRGTIMRAVWAAAIAPVAIGLAVGLLVAWRGAVRLEGTLFAVAPGMPLPYVSVSVVMATMGALASYGAVRKLLRVDTRQLVRHQ